MEFPEELKPKIVFVNMSSRQYMLYTLAREKEREEGKKKILWGLVGMFIMVSAYGLIQLVLNTFSINGPNYLGL